MELSELVDRTAKISCLDIRLELPPNQASPCKSQNNLLGKLISSKVIGFNTVRDVVGKAWRPSFPLEVKRLEGNLFLFSFHHEADLLKAFRRRPWSIRGGHLILKKWSSDLAWKEVDFSLSSLWVQVHGLPPLWQSECNLKAIGSKVGNVIEVDFAGEGDSGWKRFTRIMVDVDISKPLILGVFLPRPKLSDLWISLKYEKIADVCYRCGLIGHDEKFCHEECFVLENPLGISFRAAGPWLRAESAESPHGLYNAAHSMCPPPSASVSENSPSPPPSQAEPTCHQSGTTIASLNPLPEHDNLHVLNSTCQGKDTNAPENENAVASPLTHPIDSGSPSDDVEKNVSGLLPNLIDNSLAGPSSPYQPDKLTKPSPKPISSQLESPDHFTSPLYTHSPTHNPYDHNDVSADPHQNLITETSLPCSPPTLKRKVTQEDLAIFSKRLKKTTCSPEPVFFDPVTATLIPQSKLELFFQSEREKTSATPTKIHGESLKPRARRANPSPINAKIVSTNVCSSVSSAEEAGLAMPPTSP